MMFLSRRRGGGVYVDSRTGMLSADSIEKPKIKTKRKNSHNFGHQISGESVEKQRNGMRLKFWQIRHTLGSKSCNKILEDFCLFWCFSLKITFWDGVLDCSQSPTTNPTNEVWLMDRLWSSPTDFEVINQCFVPNRQKSLQILLQVLEPDPLKSVTNLQKFQSHAISLFLDRFF